MLEANKNLPKESIGNCIFVANRVIAYLTAKNSIVQCFVFTQLNIGINGKEAGIRQNLEYREYWIAASTYRFRWGLLCDRNNDKWVIEDGNFIQDNKEFFGLISCFVSEGWIEVNISLSKANRWRVIGDHSLK